jgi:hypothetical protein
VRYALAADAVLVLHLCFIAFAACGALLVLWRGRIAWLHLPALAWAAWIVASHGICPLTPLENALRRAAGEAGYAGGFIDHYLVPLIYPPGLTPEHQDWIAAGLVALNALLYGFALFRRRRP